MPHIIQRSTFKDTLNDILHVLGKVQIGRIGIPKQIRGEIFETLSPRGVCSRIPHLRLFCRDSHGLFFAHVYAHIIPFLGCPTAAIPPRYDKPQRIHKHNKWHKRIHIKALCYKFAKVFYSQTFKVEASRQSTLRVCASLATIQIPSGNRRNRMIKYNVHRRNRSDWLYVFLGGAVLATGRSMERCEYRLA